ncbi:MAG TPA: YfiR family protein [Terriglobales bacterium]|jgi:YfiR/HmsC-like|nr:YfiR family protein [Terriglobales bacterium]
MDTVSTDLTISELRRASLSWIRGSDDPNRPARRCLIVVLTCLLVFPFADSDAQQSPSEFQVKAAYLFNFGKFVRWQNDRAVRMNSFDICVLGKDPFGTVLDATVAGETIDGKSIKASRLSSAQEAAHCNVLFVASSEQGRLSEIFSVTQRLNVLTVSDLPHFAERGGMIGLVRQQDRIRFEVNRTAAEKANLVLSSELLKLATKVIEKPLAENR